jgi:hypothetical protein
MLAISEDISMTKTIEDYFRDWETSAFGFGYGSGEPHIIPALKTFLSSYPGNDLYDYEDLDAAITPTVTWLLINVLCRQRIIEYGTSPRYGWLTPQGRDLKEFVDKHSVEELLNILDRADRVICYPDACNCAPEGYKSGVKCKNPFWQ